MVLNGHRFYLLNHSRSIYSYAYDLDTGEWVRMSGFGATKLDLSGSFFGPWTNGTTTDAYASLAVLPNYSNVFRVDSLAASDGGAGIPLRVVEVARWSGWRSLDGPG